MRAWEFIARRRTTGRGQPPRTGEPRVRPDADRRRPPGVRDAEARGVLGGDAVRRTTEAGNRRRQP
jgi:hypothetical protein